MSTFNEKQQRAFVDGDWAWAALPKWVKVFSLVVGLPAFIAMGYLTFAGEDRTSWKFAALFLAFGVVCLLQIGFALRAFRRLGKDG